ncbi:recA bacterial DNA recombination family protein [Mycobacterium xenopi 4042]|uniref:Protein RecA n=1 Tax=Mycobacterium xenopi 4042 TaxID=1299334 RepID=X8CFF3_MYCXE|nr:recA bacterial DNA recombination family protein [Mycobacterium xenopi 4042]
MAQIEKSYGKGSVMRLGDESRQPISVIPTGSIALDVALGIGGLPRGRIVEIYGPESSGKTTVALHAVANAQAAGASRRSSTPSMRWIRSTPKSSGRHRFAAGQSARHR